MERHAATENDDKEKYLKMWDDHNIVMWDKN